MCLISIDTFRLDEALTAEKHNELYILSKCLSLHIEYVKTTIASWLALETPDEFSEIISLIEGNLE
jgi:hypothetical protein